MHDRKYEGGNSQFLAVGIITAIGKLEWSISNYKQNSLGDFTQWLKSLYT